MNDELEQRLRRRIEGWKPGMTVEVRVDELGALLDELEEARARCARAKMRAELDAIRARIAADDLTATKERV